MTASEKNAIARLSDKLDGYHEDVVAGFARCEACRADVSQLKTDIYGLPGNKEASPGLMGEVAELRGGRKRLLLAMQCVWGLLLAIAGTVAATFLGHKE